MISEELINVRFSFDKDLVAKNGIELIAYAEFDGFTEIDLYRNVHNDY